MGSAQGEGALPHMVEEEKVNHGFDYQSWYVQKRINDMQERVHKCRAWKIEKMLEHLDFRMLLPIVFKVGA
jgi:hypothetical protein